MKQLFFLLVPFSLLFVSGCQHTPSASSEWTVDSQDAWHAQHAQSNGIEVVDGVVRPTGKTAFFSSTLKQFSTKRSAARITINMKKKLVIGTFFCVRLSGVSVTAAPPASAHHVFA